jgi:apolipoprotein N-acyltransferase
VENGIFIIRCANTGVSCIIDPNGRIVKRLQDGNGQDLFVRGILNGTTIPTESETFYTRNGDLAPILAIAVSLIFIFIAWSKPLAKRKIAHAAEGQ